MVGIVGYGVSIPKKRIKVDEIAFAWGKDGEGISKSLGVIEKTIPSIDEDTTTLATEAAIRALQSGKIQAEQIQSILIGSESHPYAVNPTSTIVGEILGVGNNYLSADLEFACKAGTTAIQLIYGLVETGKIKYGMAIGADTAQAKPGDVLEYTAGAGGAAYILGKTDLIAEILGFTSFSSNTPDFWRRDLQKYPSHGGRFTGEPAYFAHVLGASNNLLTKLKLKPSDFDHAVFHMPNGKFPKEVAKKLGFSEEQLNLGFVVSSIGNPYSGSSIIGLASVLDSALPNKAIFVCSYGSGAGSDAFVFRTTNKISAFQKKKKYKVRDLINDKRYASYLDVTRL